MYHGQLNFPYVISTASLFEVERAAFNVDFLEWQSQDCSKDKPKQAELICIQPNQTVTTKKHFSQPSHTSNNHLLLNWPLYPQTCGSLWAKIGTWHSPICITLWLLEGSFSPSRFAPIGASSCARVDAEWSVTKTWLKRFYKGHLSNGNIP